VEKCKELIRKMKKKRRYKKESSNSKPHFAPEVKKIKLIERGKGERPAKKEEEETTKLS